MANIPNADGTDAVATVNIPGKAIAFAVSPEVSKLFLGGEVRHIPDVPAVREQFPLFDGLFAYFPAALCEVARWSLAGNEKHNPGEPLHWSRSKSTDHENKILRHMLDARSMNDEGFVEAVGMAWRALALCQTILEERGAAQGVRARSDT